MKALMIVNLIIATISFFFGLYSLVRYDTEYFKKIMKLKKMGGFATVYCRSFFLLSLLLYILIFPDYFRETELPVPSFIYHFYAISLFWIVYIFPLSLIIAFSWYIYNLLTSGSSGKKKKEK